MLSLYINAAVVGLAPGCCSPEPSKVSEDVDVIVGDLLVAGDDAAVRPSGIEVHHLDTECMDIQRTVFKNGVSNLFI
jgi:hypothetical protein